MPVAAWCRHAVPPRVTPDFHRLAKYYPLLATYSAHGGTPGFANRFPAPN